MDRPANSRWHRMRHGTAFRTRWSYETMLSISIASFSRCIAKPGQLAWSHRATTTDTLVVGRDPEIDGCNPISVCIKAVCRVGGLWPGPRSWASVLAQRGGAASEDEQAYIRKRMNQA